MSIGYIMMDLMGTSLKNEERKLLQHPAIAGILLFARNYESRAQLKALIAEVRSIRDPLLIAVDQEGGRVQRFKQEFTRLPPLAEFGRMFAANARQTLNIVENSGYMMASELIALGVDISFAPVLDLAYGLSEVIGDRSFHRDPDVVTLLANAYIDGMHKAGMVATGKHFPGHGGVVADSHEEMPIDSREIEEILQEDILPFVALKDKLWGIMSAHVQYIKVDNYPASFSGFWLQKILRENIGFHGAIISDDLTMQGASSLGETYTQRAEKALTAGCDMLIVANCPEGVLEILESLPYTRNEDREQRLLKARC